MTLFQTLKRNAIHSLRGNWAKAIGAYLILALCWVILALLRQYAITIFVPATAAGAGTGFAEFLFSRASVSETVILFFFVLVSVLLEAPLVLGIMKWHYRLALGTQVPFAEIFCYYERFGLYIKSVWLFVSVSVRAFLWAFLFFSLPGTMLGLSIGILNMRMGFLLDNTRAAANIGGMALFVSALFLVAAVVLYAAFMNRYTLSFYLFFENEGAKITDILRRAIHYSKGYRLNMLGFFMTFTGWFVLCVFVAPAFYAVPYCAVSMAMYAGYLIERRNREGTEHTREFSMEEQAERPMNGTSVTGVSNSGTPSIAKAPLPGRRAAEPAPPMAFPQNTHYGYMSGDGEASQHIYYEIPATVERGQEGCAPAEHEKGSREGHEETTIKDEGTTFDNGDMDNGAGMKNSVGGIPDESAGDCGG